MSKAYSIEEYAAIFNEDGTQSAAHDGGYRVKTITSGDVMEIEVFPYWNKSKDAGAARKQAEKHKEAVGRVNRKNRVRKLQRLINSNFGAGDLLITLTYRLDTQPQTEEEAVKCCRNFLRRLKRRREKAGLPETKYVYITEVTHGALGTRYHHHMIVSGGISMDEVEAMWRDGLVNVRKARPDQHGLSGWAGYMTKMKETQEKAGRHAWCCSKNLKKPKVTTADKKLSVRKALRMADDMQNYGAAILTRLYPKYDLVEAPEVKTSSWTAGVYVYARFHRTGADARFDGIIK